MRLKRLELVNFRSYGRESFDFSDGLNLIIGPNGAGKTNLLEAIYTLANTRSWREPDRNLTQEGQESFRLGGELDNKKISLEYKPPPKTQKQTYLNQTAVPTREYLGHIRTVLFEPNSLEIISGGPEARRLWLDQILSIYSPEYLLTLLRYKRTVRQRNALLKSRPSGADRQQFFAWDVSLVETASRLIKTRREFCEYLDQHLAASYRQLSAKATELSISYQTKPISLGQAKDYSSALLDRLSRSLEIDLRYGFTTVGPHRDDVEFIFKGQPAAQVASRGETRTLVLAIKLVEHRWLKRVRGASPPVLLFDDVFSELDEDRRRQTLSQLKGSQVFIATTDLKGLSSQLKGASRTLKLAG